MPPRPGTVSGAAGVRVRSLVSSLPRIPPLSKGLWGERQNGREGHHHHLLPGPQARPDDAHNLKGSLMSFWWPSSGKSVEEMGYEVAVSGMCLWVQHCPAAGW